MIVKLQLLFRCLVVSLLGSLLVAGCSTERSGEDASQVTVRDTLVTVDGHDMFIRVVGDGAPPVVIDVGIAGSFEEWQPIADSLARQTTVCLYDRAGYGRSDPGPLPRSGMRVAEELKDLLRKATIEPPYVLAGHSLGGQHALIFAQENLGLVAGLVLMDPPPIDFTAGRRFTHLRSMAEEMTADWRRIAEETRSQGDSSRAVFFDTIASEHEMMFSENAVALSGVDDLDNLLVTAIASGLPNEAFGDSARVFQDFWVESNRELANLSTRGRFVLAHGSSHHLHREAADQVLEAIETMVADVRSQQQ